MSAEQAWPHCVVVSGHWHVGKRTLVDELEKRFATPGPTGRVCRLKSSAGKVHTLQFTNVGHFVNSEEICTRYYPFQSASAFLLCISVHIPYAIETLTELYFLEAHGCAPKAPIILVALRADLHLTGLTGVETTAKTRLIPPTELQQVADKIGAFAFVQLSCKTGHNLGTLMKILADALDYSESPHASPSSGITKVFGKLWSSDPKPNPAETRIIGSPSTKLTGPPCSALEIFGGGTSISPSFSYGHTCAVHKNTLFFFGGSGPQKQLRASPCILDMSTESPRWVPSIAVESAPTLHTTAAASALQPSPPVMPKESLTGVVPPGSQFAAVGSFPAMCIFAPLVFLFGGTFEGSSTNRLLSYDMDAGVWNCLFPHSIKSATDNFPGLCYGASLIRFQTKLFLFGGCTQDNCNCQFFEFDLDSHTWRCIPESTAPPPRYHHNAFVSDIGKMYILGGLGAGNSKLSDLWEYDLNSRFAGKHTGWRHITITGSVRPTPQRGHVGCIMPSSNSFLLCGSSNSNPHCEIFQLDLGSFKWSPLSFESSSVAREFHSVTPYGSSLLIAGGMWRRAEGGFLGDAFQLVFPKYISVVPLLALDTWIYLLSFLELPDLCRLSQTCKAFYALCGTDEVWKNYVDESIRNEKNLRRKFLGIGYSWRNPTPGVLKFTPQHWERPRRVIYECFLGNAFILMGDLSTRLVHSVRPGDLVMTEAYKPHRIQEIHKKKVDKHFRMVFLNGVGLTTGHPVFVNGQWVRSCDIAPPILLREHQLNLESNEDLIYNFVLEGGPLVSDHSVILNGLLVCTLGKDCGDTFRIRHPQADSKYGTGFWVTYVPCELHT
ncbi:hypothetical protein Pelo_13047 [Pelomyxa schiedti]|nr:hypothetical protein Pelo_13047 [Pelomyxa schiedti]